MVYYLLFLSLNSIIAVQVYESSTGRFEGNDVEKPTNAGYKK